jgi:hypothetical protein
MIINDRVIIKTSNKNISYYKSIGYDVHVGDSIEIKIIDLPKTSKFKIDVKCDNCEDIKKVGYCDYMKVFTKKNKYYCSKCKGVSIREGVNKKYGVDNVFQLDYVKEKSKKTFKELYGFDHHLQNKYILEKQKETNNLRYGVDFITQLNINNKSNETFIDESKLIHDNFYDYSLCNYVNSLEKVKIICPVHGVFEQVSNYHLRGSGCPKCGLDITKTHTVLGIDKFKEISNKIHNNKYNYDRVDYINSYTKVEILCSVHGSFLQKPNDHISSKSGCPVCKESKGEKLISGILLSNDIIFEYQKRFNDLKYKSYLYFDFYLPDLNMCIEFDGEQHFRPVVLWGDEDAFIDLQIRDKLKTDYCLNKNIRLLRLDYLDYNNNDINNKLKKFLDNNKK